MPKYTKTSVTQLSANEQAAIDQINKNFDDIQTAIADTVSRSGSIPSHMTADLDMNGKRIINVPTPTSDLDLVRKKDVVDDIATVQALVNTTTTAAAQTLEAAQAVQEIMEDTHVTLVADDLALGDNSKIKQVANNKTNIDTVAGSISNVNSVGSDIANVNTVASNTTNINTVAGISSDVTTVAGLSEDIPVVVSLKDDIPVVVQAAEDIDKVEDIAADVITVAGISANVTTVASNSSNVTTVATNISDVSTVATDISDVTTVATNISDVSDVATNISDINDVQDNLTDISAVASNNANITAVANNETNINAVAGNSTNINAVNANKTNIDSVAVNNSNITAVANNATNINAVNSNKTNIDTVAGISSNVSTVASISSNVTTVAGISSSVSSVATNSSNINSVASDLTNINAVAADLTNIDNASSYAAEAKQWAIGDPSEPSGGSAKYWAGQASAGQLQADWNQTDNTKKDYIKNKPTIDDLLPTQTSQSGKFLTTNGSVSSWATVDALPSQSGQSGKYLTTNGTSASWAVPKTHDLFDFKWTDYELNDQSWLRADTYSWQDGTVYSEAYNHLVDDIDGKTATTETIDGTTVTYYLADDGHKIVDVSDVSAIETVYSSTGVAWYYVLDTANQRFKLPRENPAREVLAQSAPVIGDGSKFGLVNLSDNTERNLATFGTGAGYALCLGSNSVNTNNIGVSKDNTKSGVVADFSNVSGVNKGKNYLYFYVGQFSQSATEQTAGLNASLFNGKADTDLNNVSAGIDFVVESYQNGTDWYRLYKSGWVEQGGRILNATNNAYSTVNLHRQFADTNYTILTTPSASRHFAVVETSKITISSFKAYISDVSNNTSTDYQWFACGMSAQS